MKRKGLAKLLGMNDDDWKVVAERFTAVLLKHMSVPFPSREFSNLISEFTDKNKRSLANLLNIQLKVPADRPFPDDRFIKLILPRMTSPPVKSKVLKAIIAKILPLYANIDELSAQGHLEAEANLINEFGPWHYYWSLRLFPFEDEGVLNRLNELGSELPDPVREEPEEGTTNGKKTKENPNERSMIQRERKLRQKAERETEATKKELRILLKEVERLLALNADLLKDRDEQGQFVAKYKDAYENEQRRASTLDREKDALSEQLRKAEETIQSLQERERSLKVKLESETSSLQSEIARLERELFSHKAQVTDEGLVQRIIQVLNSKVDNLYVTLRDSQSSIQKVDIRNKISDALLLINSLESFFLSDAQRNSPASVADPAPEQQETAVLARESFESMEEPGRKQFLGTFYRKDHGGYIVLENNETFNIPESMVISIGLEHEAAVVCEPQPRQDGSTAYYVQLLLQGDDSKAPIRQYLGYVQLGDHFKYYCVDINNPENKFPIYEKDVEMQRPLDGDPCSFNVAIDGEYARLSKVYKRSEQSQASESFLKSKSDIQLKTEKAPAEPFLEGCKIVIVGGLAKWFESVVREIGAELIHDTGENPERIHSQLRRANALFLLLTANSHNATWSCVEIAKKNQIPHFRIEGSKSNLRKLLWENQHLIRRVQLKLKQA